jgi:putative acetyltransferase
MMRIVPGDLGDPRVIDLLQIHLKRARAETAPGSAHALDLAGLQSPDISFWTIWDDEVLLGFGALKRLSADHGEVKSMHIIESKRGKGIGSAMLRHIMAAARAQAMSRLSLETGSWDYFQPARARSIASTALSNARRLAVTCPIRTASSCRSISGNHDPMTAAADPKRRVARIGPFLNPM